MDEVLISPAKFDEAAKYVASLQGDAIWERMPPAFKEGERKKVEHILSLLGIDLPGSNG